jgi:ABC-2 type transport system permease protein
LRFVYPMMSTEGMSFWTIRSAPIHMRKVFWLKFMFAAIPILIIGELLAFESQRPFWEFPAVIPVAMSSVFFVSFAIVGLNLGLGSFFSDFRESNPIQIASSQGATLTFLLTIVFLIFLVAALFYPINLYFEAVIKRSVVDTGILFGSAIAVAAVSLVTLLMTSLLGIRSLKRDM